jgi:hypothetical protein
LPWAAFNNQSLSLKVFFLAGLLSITLQVILATYFPVIPIKRPQPPFSIFDGAKMGGDIPLTTLSPRLFLPLQERACSYWLYAIRIVLTPVGNAAKWVFIA